MIEERKLYTVTGRDKSGKPRKHVHVEGWTTLIAMLGVLPREVCVEEREGVFTATVELVRMTDGFVVGRGSAECGFNDEFDRSGNPVWAKRPRYARRSMAITRATGKACRLSFSWIMVLAGYDPTPAEEMPIEKAEPPAAVDYLPRDNTASHEDLAAFKFSIQNHGLDEKRVLEYAKKWAEKRGKTIHEFYDLRPSEIAILTTQLGKLKEKQDFLVTLARQGVQEQEDQSGLGIGVKTPLTAEEFLQSVKIMNLEQCQMYLISPPNFLSIADRTRLITALDERMTHLEKEKR
jgi:hypothetical protein